MAFVDQIFIGVSGFMALAIIWVLITRYEKSKELFNFYYIFGFALILTCSILILFYQWDILGSTYITLLASLIPMSISLGLVRQFFKKLTVFQIIFTIVGGAGILTVQLLSISWWQIAVYSIATFSILEVILLPFIASRQKKAEAGFWWVGFSGILALLFMGLMYLYTTGTLFLFFSIPVILAILSPLYSLTIIALFWGFMQEEETEELSIEKEPLS